MARTVRNAKLDSRSARARLKARREPYWTVIAKGRALGYRRGSQGGSWIARYRGDDGQQRYQALGPADDTLDADEHKVLTFEAAQGRARRFFADKDRDAAGDFRPSKKPYTVADAIEDYLRDYRRRGGKAEERIENAARVHILPVLGDQPIGKLRKRQLEAWLEGVAEALPRVRAVAGQGPRFRDSPVAPDRLRSRKASANRVLTVLKAALNHALREGRATDGNAWQAVKPYREVDSARLRYLSDSEARRLVNACQPDFRTLVVAALLTGCRYSELARLTVEDFDVNAGTVRIAVSKSGRPRHVALSTEGRDFFARQIAGRPPGARILVKANGRGWSKSDQQRPLEAACLTGRVAPITFHGLRHTYASRLAMKGAPLAVIAAQLGHSDTRMVEKHYGHLAPNYVAETVRAAFGRLDIVDLDPVVPIKAAGQS